MSGYAELACGVAYLKNLDAVVDDAQEGITQADLDLAQLLAKGRIDATFAPHYDTSGWADEPPALIVEIALLLGSAKVLTMKFGRMGTTDLFSKTLLSEAEDIITDVVSAKLELVDGDGNVIRRRGVTRPLVQ